MTCEPIERLVCDVPADYVRHVSSIKSELAQGRASAVASQGQDRMRLEFLIPSRGLFGYRSEFLTDTRGEGIMSSVFEDYEPCEGRNSHPSRAAPWWPGKPANPPATPCSMLQDRGELFIEPGVKVYNGMIIGAVLPSRRH